MVQETIAAVQETEIKAERLLEAAEQESVQILEKAREEAKTLQEQKESQAKADAAAAMQKVRLEGEERLKREEEAVKVEIQELKKKASGREDGAVELILSYLFA